MNKNESKYLLFFITNTTDPEGRPYFIPKEFCDEDIVYYDLIDSGLRNPMLKIATDLKNLSMCYNQNCKRCNF